MISILIGALWWLAEVILQAGIDFAWFLASPIVNAIPDWEPPDLNGMAATIAPLFEFFGWANHYLPLTHAVIIIGLLSAAWLLDHGLRLFQWVVAKFPTMGGWKP